MDSLFVPPVTPAIRPAYLGASSAANVAGQGYTKTPRVAGTRSAPNTPAVVAKLGNGYVVVGSGGYYAPKTQRIP